MLTPSAAYVHIPFCASKCFYCEFNSYPGLDYLFDEYVEAVCLEIKQASHSTKLESIYFGGGTPSILSAKQLSHIISMLHQHFPVSDDAEITIEANPGTVDETKLKEIRSAGFNRLSLGVQSFDDSRLSKLGRLHTAEETLEAYTGARNAGFENLSLDIMFALPGQTLFEWKNTLVEAVELTPEHISLYELSIEDGTKFAEYYSLKLDYKTQKSEETTKELPGEELKLEMHKAAIDVLAKSGYEHYEVSNFAQKGYRSRHNQVYWRNEPYYGFGAGATSYIEGIRRSNLKSPQKYIDAIKETGSAVDFAEQVSRLTSMGETLMLALRTKDGLDRVAFQKRYGIDVLEAYPDVAARLIKAELIDVSEDKLKLTEKGLFIADEVAQEFLP